MTQEEKVIINIDTKDAKLSLQDLNNIIDESRNTMLNAEEGTKEWTMALRDASDAQYKLDRMNELITSSAADFGVVMQNTTSVMSGVVGGINSIIGVTTLLGNDNEKLMESLVKLQAGMAIVQGLEGIDGMVKSFKNLLNIMRSTGVGMKILTAVQRVWNAVTAANPIFIMVGVLAAVVLGITALTRVLGKNKDEFDESNKTMDGTILRNKELIDLHNQHTERIKEIDIELRILNGTLTEFDRKIMEINKNYEKQIEDISSKTEEELEKTGGFWRTLWDVVSTGNNVNAAIIKQTERMMNIKKDEAEVIKKIEETKNKELELIREKENQKELDEERKRRDELLKEKQKLIDEQKKLYLEEREYIKNIQFEMYLDTLSDRDRELVLLESEYNKRRELFEKHNIEMVKLEMWKNDQIKNINDRYKTEEEEYINDREEMAWELAAELYQVYHQSNMSELELLNNKYQSEKSLLEEFNISTTKLTDWYEKEKTRILEEESIRRKELQMEQFNELLNMTIGLSNTLSAISNMRMERDLKLAGDNEEKKEKIRKEAFERNKKLEIANTIISGLNGVINALAAKSVIPEPGGSILKAANAALIGVTTAANVAAIKNTTYESASFGMTPNNQQNNYTPSIPPQMSDQINPVRTINTENEIELQRKPIKAYVVDSEVEAKRKINDNIKNEADF